MKLLALLGAGALAAGSMTVAAPASAQYHGHPGYHRGYGHSGYHRGYYGGDRRVYHGHRYRPYGGYRHAYRCRGYYGHARRCFR